MKILSFIMFHLQVKKIVQGQFELFQSMYKPFIQEYETKELLRYSLSGNPQPVLSQVYFDPYIVNMKRIQYYFPHLLKNVD